MKRELKAPPKLTREETVKLNQCIWMADWHFEETIKKKCTEIESYCIHWARKEWKQATVYGLEAMKIETKEHTIANLFVRYSNRVYQTRSLKTVEEITQLLKKEEKYDEYEDKMNDRKYKERQKVLAQKKTGKLKKPKEVPTKKAA